MAGRIRIGLLAADPLIQEARRSLLATQKDFDVVFEASLAQDALERIPNTSIDVLLVDARLRGSTGLDFAARMHRRYLGEDFKLPKVILAVPFYSDEIQLEAIRVGASDLVVETDHPEALFDAITAASQKERVTDYQAMRAFFIERKLRSGENPRWLLRLTDISSRERKVLNLLEHGLSDEDMAKKLNLTVTSIRWAIDALMVKMGVATREQFALALYEAGVLYADLQVDEEMLLDQDDAKSEAEN